MLQDHVRALLDQRLCRVCFFGGVHPLKDPDNFELNVRVYFFGVNVGGVDATHNFGDWHGCDVAHDVALGHFACNVALNGAALIEARGIGANVIGSFVAGCVLEFHIWKFFSHVDGWVHEAKRCGENQIGAGERHLCHHAFCVRTFGNVFNKDGLDRIAKVLFEHFTAVIVTLCPAAIIHGADVDKAHFGFFVVCQSSTSKAKGQGGGGKECFEHMRSPRCCEACAPVDKQP